MKQLIYHIIVAYCFCSALQAQIKVVNAGVGGNTSADLLQRVDADVLPEKADVVVLMVGTNDMLNSKKMISYQNYTSNLKKIIQRIQTTTSKIVLMAPPPADSVYLFQRHKKSAFKESPNAKLDRVRDLVRQQAEEYKLGFIDLYQVFQQMNVPQHNTDLFIKNEMNSGAKDGVHPTALGYRFIGELVFQYLKEKDWIREGSKLVCFGDSITKGGSTKKILSGDGTDYPSVLMRLILEDIDQASLRAKRKKTKQNPTDAARYWNNETPLVSYRLPPPPVGFTPTLKDLDNDGDPDIIYSQTIHNTPIVWIDDDDDLKMSDLEGDTDSDCLLIDVNKDGRYADAGDIAIDWIDTDGDGRSDMQVFVENAKKDALKRVGPGHYMWVIDDDQDQVFNYVDWNTFKLRAWLHEGKSNFLEDYLGKSTFLKSHNSTYYMNDLRLNWENPFLFFDPDEDGLTEIAFRGLDRPQSRKEKFNEGKMSYVAVSFDLDNDTQPGNAFDYDMSIRFKGKGFDYMDQVHKFNNQRVKETDSLFKDVRWRQLDELIYPGFDTAFDLTYSRGDWETIYFVYDEDDDCERWERVEFYEPRDPFKVGKRNGGLDNNPQADAIGDRGEWDLDNSGKANLYISTFDGRIHLYGAEHGVWRVDQLAKSFQSWGGMYDDYTKNKARLQKEFTPFSTFSYKDTDDNGFFDLIEIDVDGDTVFEKTVSLKSLGIADRCTVIDASQLAYADYRKLHTNMADTIWQRATTALDVAERSGINTAWYAFMKTPKSENQKYRYGYWIQFYIYMDLIHQATQKKDSSKIPMIDKAYFSGDWSTLVK